MAAPRTRLDIALVRRGLARTRSEASTLIADGRVTVAGAPARKPATLVAPDQAVAVEEGRRWASRGGYKLAGALDELGVEVAGRQVLDAGASTGGFTDVLLARGARRVVAVDVGYGQLDWRLASDERVVVVDRTNIRHVGPEDLPGPAPTLVTADLSFISLTAVLPALRRVAEADADFVVLVKPQFEVAAAQVRRGGVVRDPAAWRAALERVAAAAAGEGLALRAVAVSPLRGPAGNVEFFAHLTEGVGNAAAGAIDEAVSLASGA